MEKVGTTVPKYTPVRLSERWATELTTLKVPPNAENIARNMVAVLHTADLVGQHLERRLHRRKFLKQPILERITVFYFAHCYHMGYSVYRLAKLGYSAGTMVLVRAIVEAVIDLSYLWLCKDINGKGSDEREAWADHMNVTRSSIDRMWLELQKHRRQKELPPLTPERLITAERSQSLSAEAEQYKRKYQRDFWALKRRLDQRARCVDDLQILSSRTGFVLEEDYIQCYKWLSEVVHGNSAAVHQYMRLTPTKLHVDLGPNWSNADMALAMAVRFLSAVLFVVNHVNHLEVDLPAQYEVSGMRLDP